MPCNVPARYDTDNDWRRSALELLTEPRHAAYWRKALLPEEAGIPEIIQRVRLSRSRRQRDDLLARAYWSAWRHDMRSAIPRFRTYPRDRAALVRGDYNLKTERRGAAWEALDELFDNLTPLRVAGKGELLQLYQGRWERRHACRTALLVRRLLGSDDLRRPIEPLDPISDKLPAPEPPDPFDSEEHSAQLAHVFACATPEQRQKLEMVLAVLRGQPELPVREAAAKAGLTTDQMKKLTTRLRRRIAPA